MILDLTHNKIVEETISEKFAEQIESRLVPMLVAEFGEEIYSVQMYEDYIEANFSRDGYWYYPMTLSFGAGCGAEWKTVWVRWNTSCAKDFIDGVPYSFVGEALDIELCDSVPQEFVAVRESGGQYCESGLIKLNINSGELPARLLSGKYSQTFVDEMARQLTAVISSACGIENLSDSSIELDMIFTSQTYMEHTSESVTYRRLLMSAKGCAPRDFWVKWSRLDASGAYSSRDSVKSADIRFELGEDVPHKMREREYRFLIFGNSDKYRNAMGKKNITEWRELVKRALKRGELIKTVADMEVASHSEELSDKLNEILTRYGGAPSVSEFAMQSVEISSEAQNIAESACERYAEQDSVFDIAEVIGELENEPAEASDVEELFDKFEEETEEEIFEETEEEPEEEEIFEETKEEPEEEEIFEETEEETEEEIFEETEEETEEEEIFEEAEEEPEVEIDSEIFEEIEYLRGENERLSSAVETLTERIERLELELSAIKARAVVAPDEEDEPYEEAEFIEEKLFEESEFDDEPEQAEEAELIEEECVEEEVPADEPEQVEEPEPVEAVAPVGATEYTYVSKVVKLMFRHDVDPNVKSRIKEIVAGALEFYHKENVYMRVKAKITEPTVVVLDFVEYPEEEGELLINIIKKLGNSDLGIAKVILE